MITSTQENLYGTTIEAVAVPARNGKLVVLQCTTSAIRRLQLFGNIHPVVVFIKPHAHDEENDTRKANSPSAFQDTLDIEDEYKDCFTHVLQEADIDKLAIQIGDIVEQELSADGFWARIPALLPRIDVRRSISLVHWKNKNKKIYPYFLIVIFFSIVRQYAHVFLNHGCKLFCFVAAKQILLWM